MGLKLWLVLSAITLGLVACSPEAASGTGGVSGFGGTGGSAAVGGTGGTGAFGGASGAGGTGGVGAFGGTGGTGGFAAIGGGSCKPGHYIGTFMGRYRSTHWGNGEDANALDVMAMDDPVAMTVGLEFWLQATGRECAPGDEFCGGYEIKSGKMRGNAMAGFVLVPFDIDLTGELDCNSGQFIGRLENGYYVAVGIARSTFAGDIIAQYDSSTFQFVNGTWDVVEDPPMMAAWPPGMNIGGEGTWSAGWADDSPPPAMP